MTQLVIIADDLTGAADSAALFAERGLATAVPLGDCPSPDADVLSLSTESRDSTPDEAEALTRAAIARLRAREEDRPQLVYKKLDSALRGHPGRELIATMDACGRRLAVVAPALPSEGRTTIGGRQCIGGVPLEESAFARDGVSSDLIAAFSGHAGIAVAHVALVALRSGELAGVLAEPEDECRIVVVDAEHDGDLDRIAREALAAGVTLLAGSAGLARALVRTAGLRPRVQAPPWRPARGRPLLVIAGTQHEAARMQIERAAEAGALVIRPEQATLDAEFGDMTALSEQVATELARGRAVIVTTAGLRPCPLGAGAVAERLARVAESRAVQALVGGMMLTGGDVAAAVCAKLGASAIWLRGEVRPAIPWGTLAGGKLPGLPIVTKAGSFGAPDTLLACLAHLAMQDLGR